MAYTVSLRHRLWPTNSACWDAVFYGWCIDDYGNAIRIGGPLDDTWFDPLIWDFGY